MRSREAWLAAMTAVLGVSDVACKKDATDAPAAVREVPSASSSSSAAIVASASPDPSASAASAIPEVASAAPSASSSVAVAVAKPQPTATIGLGHLSCGRTANPICGAVAYHDPTPQVFVRVESAVGTDNAIVETQLRPRARACANNAAKRDPNIRGDVTLRVAVDATGAVTQVDLESSTIADASAANCMKAAARALKFAAGTARNVRVTIRTQVNN